MPKRLYIETVGCQMNMLDSEMVVANLRRQGYELTSQPQQADTVLFNTCSVRQQAEEKTYGSLGKLKDHKQRHPDVTIGVMGCMAQKDQQLIFGRAPYVDFVVGPGQLQEIPRLIEEARAGTEQQLAVGLGRRDGSLDEIKRSHETFDPLRDPDMRSSPYQAYLRIQIGCDKFCTYCVVPNTRGPEQGRAPEQIESEARVLADQGTRELILLGQTVNSYRHQSGDTVTRLSDLLARLHQIEGIERLKFVTNYPRDMTDDLLHAIRDLSKVSPYLHLPLQSGSNRVLRRMKRGYTFEIYDEMMTRIRETIPGTAISSDFIVGFCGETEDDFDKSVAAVNKYRFKNSFIFKYSERPGTKAADQLPDDVPLEVKQRRNQELLSLQNEISEVDNQAFLGRSVDVLVEGPSKREVRHPSEGPIIQMTGRTHCDRIVVWDGNPRQAGQLLPVTIYDANAHTLFGHVVTEHAGPEMFDLNALPTQ